MLINSLGELLMKKHLIAAAVAAAVAVPAMAQNVTLGGLIDVGARSVSPTGAASGVAMSHSAVSTSNINITGSEDLGGGLRASFNLNSALTPSTGALGGADATAPTANLSTAPVALSNIFSREASVSLSGGFGALTLGRTDTSQSEAVDTFVGQFGNMSYFPSGGEYGSDQASMVRYQLSTLVNGLTIQAGRSALDGNSTTDVDSFSASYAAGPFGLIVGYDNLGGAAPAKYMAYGLRYDAGFVSVGYASGKRDVKLTAVDITNTALSFRAPWLTESRSTLPCRRVNQRQQALQGSRPLSAFPRHLASVQQYLVSTKILIELRFVASWATGSKSVLLTPSNFAHSGNAVEELALKKTPAHKAGVFVCALDLFRQARS
jgi:predicted porin